MKLLNSVRIGIWLLIFLNLFMGFGAIWFFLRMAPAIDNIIKKNTNTLVLCEKMLTCVAQMSDNSLDIGKSKEDFVVALKQAERNITEEGEPRAIAEITSNYSSAFAGDSRALSRTLNAIITLSAINKKAMEKEDHKARKLGSAGAWGVVFMATAVFIVTILLFRGIRRNLIYPIEEIHDVIVANLKGDSLRRCFGAGVSRDVKVLYAEINEVLDSPQKTVSNARFEE